MNFETKEEIERRYQLFNPPATFNNYTSMSTDELTGNLSEDQLKDKFQELTGLAASILFAHMNVTNFRESELKRLLHVTIDVANSDLGRSKVCIGFVIFEHTSSISPMLKTRVI